MRYTTKNRGTRQVLRYPPDREVFAFFLGIHPNLDLSTRTQRYQTNIKAESFF